MKNNSKRHVPLRFALLAMLILMLSMSLGISSGAATLSTTTPKTVSGGQFVRNTKTKKWMYRYKNGTYAKHCLLNINGKTYFFSRKGYRLSGWQKINGEVYYFGTASQGYMYKNTFLKTKNGNYYLFRKSGKRVNGWAYHKSKRYYFDLKTGKRVYGWQTIKNKKYYFGAKDQGYMYRNTLITYNKRIYYLQKNGAAATGWKTVSGNTYYFNQKGQAMTGKRTINGTVYYFNSKGHLLYSGANLKLSSDCAILINADTGKVLYEKNADQQHANASTTKIMTCILALENSKLKSTVKVSANAAAQEPSKLYMKAGDSFQMQDLLYSLMLPSHNDTAVAIAEHISGSTTKFAALMNKKAKAIGCTNTNFVTPNGLDAGLNHYSTARDMAKITRYALKKSTLRKIVKTTSYNFTSKKGLTYSVANTNMLLNTMPGVTGMKTGYTSKAGYCFVGTITGQDGDTYISVVLGAPTSTARWDDSKKLLEYAYNLE